MHVFTIGSPSLVIGSAPPGTTQASSISHLSSPLMQMNIATNTNRTRTSSQAQDTSPYGNIVRRKSMNDESPLQPGSNVYWDAQLHGEEWELPALKKVCNLKF